MSNFHRIAKNSFYQTFAYGVKALSSFAIYIVLGRFGGADTLGGYVTIMTLVSLFTFVATFGLPQLLVREIAQNRHQLPQIRSLIDHSLGLVSIFSIGCALMMLAAGVGMGYTGPLLGALVLASIGLAFEAASNVWSAAFKGVEEMFWSSVTAIVMDLLFLILVVCALFQFVSLVWVLIAYVLSRVISMCFVWWLYSRRFGNTRVRFSTTQSRDLLYRSFPFAANSGLSVVYVRSDILLLSILIGYSAVGYYDAAASLVMRLNVFVRMVNDALYPFLSSRFRTDAVSIHGYTSQIFRYLLIPGFFLTAVLVLYADPIIALLYGDGFSETATLLKWLALVIPLRFLDNSLAVVLTASNRQRQRTTAIAIASFVNIVLNLALIPRLGVIAAVYSTLITECVLFSTLLWFLRHEMRTAIQWQALAAPCLALSVFVVIAGVSSPLNLWFSLVFASMMYMAVIMAMDISLVRMIRARLSQGH